MIETLTNFFKLFRPLHTFQRIFEDWENSSSKASCLLTRLEHSIFSHNQTVVYDLLRRIELLNVIQLFKILFVISVNS